MSKGRRTIADIAAGLLAHPRTTAIGAGMLAAGIGEIVRDPNVLLSGDLAAPIGLIVTGLGFLLTADAKRSR